jgi:hypothetical protein
MTDPERVGAFPGDEWRNLEDRLRRFGYDIEAAGVSDEPQGGIVARRDFEDHTLLVAIDAGGRFRVTITWVVGEWPSRIAIAGVPVRAVDTVSRAVTVTGQVERPAAMADVVAALGEIVDWAAPVDPAAALPPTPTR